MQVTTMGNSDKPVILNFHALGVDGHSNERWACYLQDDYFVINPTMSIFCQGQTYKSKRDEVAQLNAELDRLGVGDIELVCAFSIGGDIALEFLSTTKRKVGHVFFDGPQLTKVPTLVRRAVGPVIYKELVNIANTNGESVGKIFWCDDDDIKPYFARACANVDKASISNAMKDLMTGDYPKLPAQIEECLFIEFGSIEDHYPCREDVMRRYPKASYPVFEDKNHMEFTIRDPQGFAQLMRGLIQTGELPHLEFMR